MVKRARYLPRARQDLNEISERIAVDSLDAAIKFCLALEDAVNKLTHFPGMGARREFANPLLASIRSWPIRRFQKYLIFYMPAKHGIDIVRIIHGARDIDHILSADDVDQP